MDIRLKRIADQVIVITGASSGIGLTTALRAARAGASVVLAARNERVLMRIVGDIEAIGGQATYVVADVAVERDVQHIADVAIREFGGVDSWVNNASTSIFGRLAEVPLADMRRLFDVNFWGVVHGCQAAVPTCASAVARSSTSEACCRTARSRCRGSTPPPSTP